MDAAYAGITVLEVGQGIAGPHAGLLLAQHGADVLKVEPLTGDWARPLGGAYGDVSAHFVSFNRGKRSLALDLKQPQALAIARRLAVHADVLIEAFRPDVMDKLGLGYAALAADNPGLVYLSISGFGQTGPDAGRACVDSIAQSVSGFISINRGNDGEPHKISMIAMDVMTGLYGFQAVQAALFARMRSGKGRHLDVSMMQTAAAFQVAKIMEFHVEKGSPPDDIYVPIGVFRTAKGHLNISAGFQPQFITMLKTMGLDEVAADPRFQTVEGRRQHADALIPIFQAKLLERPAEEWVRLLRGAGLMSQKVNDYGEFLNEPQAVATGAFTWLTHDALGEIPVANVPGAPAVPADGPLSRAPHLGEHSRSALAALGLHEAEIDRLVAEQAVGVYAPGTQAAAE